VKGNHKRKASFDIQFSIQGNSKTRLGTRKYSQLHFGITAFPGCAKMRSTFGNAKTERRQSDAFAELEGEECPRTREASGSRRQRLWLLETGSFWNARKRARAQCMLHDPMPVLIFFPHLLDPPPSSLPYCNLVLRATGPCNNKTTGTPPGALFLPLS